VVEVEQIPVLVASVVSPAQAAALPNPLIVTAPKPVLLILSDRGDLEPEVPMRVVKR
jgi:hypothetical protein